ncbi:MAG TPA: hypothetical protein VGO78_12890, partial [Acidimicrobiales bacterium]|nr:hypothetical protein [Acidimicrobiales bacterium]
LDDGLVIMSHDAVLTAIKATGEAQTDAHRAPERDEVLQQMNRLHAPNLVIGASGSISLDAVTGSPLHKDMAIVEITSAGHEFRRLTATATATATAAASRAPTVPATGGRGRGQ